MIQIVDKNDGERKLRRSYEDYLPLETSEQTETSEPTETQETAEPTEPTTEPAEPEI